jgi:hypothetical protein
MAVRLKTVRWRQVKLRYGRLKMEDRKKVGTGAVECRRHPVRAASLAKWQVPSRVEGGASR